MNPESLKYIADNLDSIEIIRFHLAPINSFSEYTMNLTVIDAVERRLAIIGEALWKISKLHPELKVTDQKKNNWTTTHTRTRL